MPVILRRATQYEAGYSPEGGVERCGYCRHFVSQGTCNRIMGPVSPRGWCRYFSREVWLRMEPGTDDPGGVVVPAASLDLSFMTGALDPSITFTRASTATYIDATGTMQTATVNAPRFGYDPVTLAPRGMLIEEQRVNSIRNSTAQGVVVGTPGTMPTNWTLALLSSGLSGQIVATGTEGGIPYFDLRLFGTLVSGQVQIILETATAIAALTGQTWSFSHYVRLVGGTLNGISAYQVTIRELTSGGALVKDNIAGFTLFPTAAPLATQRLSGTATLSGGATTAFVAPRLIFAFVGGNPAIDVTIRIGGAQLEQGAFPTSYIPTTSAAVTRSADTATMPTGAWLNPSAGTLVGDYMVPYWPLPSGSPAPAVVELNDGTITNIITLRLNPPNQILGSILIASTSQGQLSITGGLVGTNKVGLTYTNSAMSLSANGSVAQTGTVTALPTINRLTIGFGRGGTLNGWLRRTRYWNTALSSSQLQGVTT